MPAALPAHPHDLQLGMSNPPRKAKRLRELAYRDTSGDPVVSTSNLQLPDQRACTPPASTTAPRRRGRKPAGPLSKSAREQLRKTNHSVIEKRRREKINEALAALRELVPNDKLDGEKKKEDKEFKLEILVRTVEYLRIMVEKVKNLESGLCQKCGVPLSVTVQSSPALGEEKNITTGKRKRSEGDDEDVADGSDSEVEDLDAVLFTSTPEQIIPPRSTTLTGVQPLPRLPSISSWMIDSPTEPSPVNSHTYQLPSPPQTVPFAPTTASTGFLPGLVLPPPIGSGLPSPSRLVGLSHQDGSLSARASPSFVSLGSRDRDVPELPLDAAPRLFSRQSTSKCSQASPTPYGATQVPTVAQVVIPREGDQQNGSPVSPWSRDDQTVASLLLTISSRRSSSASDEGKQNRRHSSRESQSNSVMLEAQTPSSVLGMVDAPGGEGSKL